MNRGVVFLIAPGADVFLANRDEEAGLILSRSGLVRRLRERCPNLDQVTERYAAFAQESFLPGHYQATAVMIGVAAESALLHFVPRCQEALQRLSLRPPRLKNDRGIKLIEWIEKTLRQFQKELRQALGQDSWISDIPGLLGIATGIRLTRNEAGHPSAHVVSRDECWSMIGLFPRLAEALFVTAAAFDEIESQH